MSWPGPTFAQWAARLRSLECGQDRCQCHKTARVGHGLTHCPAHGVDSHPSLSLTETIGGTKLWHCLTGCDQVALTRALFGDVMIAWSKAQWEAQHAQPPAGDVDFAHMTTAELRDIMDHLEIAALDPDRPRVEVLRLELSLRRAQRVLASRGNVWQTPRRLV